MDNSNSKNKKISIDRFNKTDYPYKSNLPIHKLLELNANKFIDEGVLFYKNRKITYAQLNDFSNKIANLLLSNKTKKEEIVAVLINRTPEMMGSIFGIMKAGGAYLPIDPKWPKSRMMEILNDAKVSKLLIGEEFLSTAETLLWESKYLSTYICVDSKEKLEFNLADYGAKQKELWEYVASGKKDDYIGGSGWRNSYNNENFSKEEINELVSDVYIKVKPHLNKNKDVLEIGCGSGLIIEKIAKDVNSYHGIDISRSAIDLAKAKVNINSLDNVKLEVLNSDDIKKLKEESYDVIIINSLVQFFPNYYYLNNFLKRALKLLKEGGVLFIGDIRDKDRQIDFYQSLTGSEKSEQFIFNKFSSEKELFVPRTYFKNFYINNAVNSLDISNKIGEIKNELYLYRYDVLMSKGAGVLKKEEVTKSRFYRVDIEKQKIENPDVDVKGTNLAYVIYTSGSTGKPKGVMIEHHSVINRIAWMKRKYKINSEDIILQKTPYTFDVSVWELFLWILSGSKLVILPQGLERDIPSTIKAIKDYKITTIHFVPSVFSIFLNYLENNKKYINDVKSLSKIFFSGEVLYKNQILKFNRLTRNNNIGLHNLYGPTEATVDVTYFNCKNILDSETIPIGLPIDNTYIYLLDKNKKQVDIEENGEVYISGVGVARGYLNNKKLTEEKFIPDPYRPGKTMYATGDIAKRLSDGNILYLDRIDNQIKIGGIRVELGDITKNILKILDIDQCAVRANIVDGKKILIAYYVSKNPYDQVLIKEKLSGLLPDYMIPNYFIHLSEMPLSASGKIAYNLLPKPDVRDDRPSLNNLLSTEEKIKALYESILRNKVDNMESNFFELGGSSLMAMELIFSVNSLFNIELSTKSFFENSKVSEVSRLVDGLIKNNTNSSTSQGIIRIESKEKYKLSDAQSRMWFLYELNRKSSLYNVLQVTKISGNLDVVALENSIAEVIKRHSILRTNFGEANGEPFQKINDNAKIKLEKIDLSKVRSEKDFFIRKEINKMFQKPFSLEKDVLFRAKLIILSDNKYLLCLCLHHIVCDGWSMFLMNEEIGKNYREIKKYGYESEEGMKLQYSDYAEWTLGDQYSKKIGEQEKFWLSEFKEKPQAISLPLERKNTLEDSNLNIVRAKINNATFKNIREICRVNDVTYFMFLLSCFYLFLGRMANIDDITIGTPIANRPYDDLKKLIGFFSNTLAIRINLSDEDTFLSLLRKVKDKLLHAYENQSYPFDTLVKKINPNRDSNTNPIFNILFTYFDANRDLLILDGAKTSIFFNELEKSKFDLTVSVIENRHNFTIEAKFNDNFSERSVKQFLDRFSLFINNILGNINNNIYSIDILTDSEKKRLLNNSGAIKKNDGNAKLYDYIENNAKLLPNKKAIKCGDNYISYSELNNRINQFASFLRKKGINRNIPVGLLMNKSIDLYVAIYSILKAGGAYVPLDPELPEDRIKGIIDEAKLEYIILNKTDSGLLSDCDDIQKIFMDDDATLNDIKKEKIDSIKKVNESTDLAYIIYTSGSTGKPKGVMCSHKGVLNTISSAADIFKISRYGKILQFGNVTFDTSVLDMNLAFYCGATLVTASKDEIRDPSLLRKILLRDKVTFGLFIPTTLYHLNINGTYLKCLASGSESISRHLVDKILKKVIFINTYGPTEFSIFCTYWKGSMRKDKYIPIGKPIHNTTIYVLDKFLRPVPMGVEGQIYISGVGLSSGYLNNLEQTKKSFIDNPFIIGAKMYKTGDIGKLLPDGNIVFIGRNDAQVKIRGFRIEFGDIESNLISYRKIKECVASTQIYGGDENIVVHYISDDSIDEIELRKYLSSRLPAYMLPRRFIQLKEMPHNINGKVDRKRLPHIDEHKFIEESDKTLVNKIINVWKKVLGVNNIDANSNFFDLGGHSILVLKALFYLKSYHGLNLSPKDFYDYPTPELISKNILNYNSNIHSKKISKISFNSEELTPKSFEKYNFKNVMVTGGTGFLGAYIINELLKNKNIENIFVTVKSSDPNESKIEISKNLKFYFKDIDLAKIIPVPSDITKEDLGIGSDFKEKIMEKVDLVIHTAADVSHVGDYAKYHKTNVLGTENLINFVKGKNGIRFCYVSTLSISGSYVPGFKKYIVRENDLEFGQTFESFYDQSKFEAEKIVRKNIENGLDAVIFRFGNLIGASNNNYIFQRNKETNAFYNYLRSIIKTGSNWGINADFNLSPINISAKMLVCLSYLKSASGKTFHVFNENIINSNDLVDIINELGNQVSKDNKNIKDMDDRFLAYLNNYIGNPNQTKFVYDNSLLRAYATKLKFKWPKINKAMVKKIINNID